MNPPNINISIINVAFERFTFHKKGDNKTELSVITHCSRCSAALMENENKLVIYTRLGAFVYCDTCRAAKPRHDIEEPKIINERKIRPIPAEHFIKLTRPGQQNLFDE